MKNTNYRTKGAVDDGCSRKKDVVVLLITKSTGSDNEAEPPKNQPTSDENSTESIEETDFVSSVFIDASIYDEKENIEKLENFSEKNCIKYISPIISERPSQYINDLNVALMDNDNVILPVENTSQLFINERIRFYNRIMTKRTKPLSIRIYNPSPKTVMEYIPKIIHPNLHISEFKDATACFEKRKLSC
jgi:hypothetical protein